MRAWNIQLQFGGVKFPKEKELGDARSPKLQKVAARPQWAERERALIRTPGAGAPSQSAPGQALCVPCPAGSPFCSSCSCDARRATGVAKLVDGTLSSV